jgi:polysaccharide export outer membrane protein
MNKSIVCLSILLLILTSCVSKKNILYFQDADKFSSVIITKPEYKIQSNDILNITISALIPETAESYNSQSTSTSNSIESLKLRGYLVSSNGTIEMPVLGTISVKNKTLIQLSEELKKILEEGGHLAKPVINIRLLNAKVTVLGEVSAPGTYAFTEQYISLPQALGYAGDLTLSGKRKDILLIRESEGLRTVTHVDLTTANWMNDPKYTIQPNYVIIVNPNTKKTQTGGYNIGDLSILFGISSFIISLIFLFKK